VDECEGIKEYEHLLATQRADPLQVLSGEQVAMDVRKVGLYFFWTTPLMRAKWASASWRV
jgi:hypothetical protein